MTSLWRTQVSGPARHASHKGSSMTKSLSELGRAAIADLDAVFAKLPDTATDPLIEAILFAKRTCLYVAGREGLALRGFAMRLFHIGRDAHMVADMTTPPVGPAIRWSLSPDKAGFRPPKLSWSSPSPPAPAQRSSQRSQVVKPLKCLISALSYPPRPWQIIRGPPSQCCL